MPANLPQLSKSHSLACLEIIHMWAAAMAAGPARDRILSAVEQLLHAISLTEKQEPGARSAADVGQFRCARDVGSEKLEPGARSAEDIQPAAGSGAGSEKLEPGTRSA